jgi:hypothetical protein
MLARLPGVVMDLADDTEHVKPANILLEFSRQRALVWMSTVRKPKGILS